MKYQVVVSIRDARSGEILSGGPESIRAENRRELLWALARVFGPVRCKLEVGGVPVYHFLTKDGLLVEVEILD